MRLFTLLIFHKKGYSQLIGGDLSTHEHSLVVFIKEGLPLICETSQESTDKNYLRSRLSLLHALLCFLLYTPVSAALTLSSDPPILISLDEPADSIIHMILLTLLKRVFLEAVMLPSRAQKISN